MRMEDPFPLGRTKVLPLPSKYKRCHSPFSWRRLEILPPFLQGGPHRDEDGGSIPFEKDRDPCPSLEIEEMPCFSPSIEGRS